MTSRKETPPIARGGWLDALRFIVAALIIVYHFQAYGPAPLADVVHPVFGRAGFLLTNFFLIDSGYVLMRVYGPALERGSLSSGDFVLKRLLRVWPAHLMMGLALIVLVLGAGAVGHAPTNPEWFAWDQLPAQLALVQGFGVHGGLGWNAPSWSVSALIGCYLAFPWIIRALMKTGPWTALALGVGLYLAANALTWAMLDLPVYQMPMRYGFFRALPLFFLGMSLAWFAQKVWIAPRLARWALIAAAIGLVVVQAFGTHALASLALISVIILAAGAVPVRKPSRLIELSAQVSFSMFITNEVVRIAWFGVMNPLAVRFSLGEPVQWALWGAGMAAAVVFAFAFHFAVDDPLQGRIRAWFKRLGRAGRTAPTRPVISLEG